MAITNCKVVYGITNVCGDLTQASGVDKDIYVGYCSDLAARISLLQTGAITGFTFLAYAGLVKFSGQKFSNEASYDIAKGAGGTVSYVHKLTIRAMNLSTQDDVEIQRLTQAQDLFAVVPDNNESFFIFGPSKGMMALPGTLKNFGKAQGEDIVTAVSLEGNEKVLPLRLDAGGYQTTLNLLESLIR